MRQQREVWEDNFRKEVTASVITIVSILVASVALSAAKHMIAKSV